MTVYTDLTLTSWFVDDSDVPVFEFVDALGNDVIITGDFGEEEEPPVSGYAGFILLGQICT